MKLTPLKIEFLPIKSAVEYFSDINFSTVNNHYTCSVYDE